MIRIMFVCHGNICRSPMAEMILKEMVRQRGLADQFQIASSATSTEEIWGDIGNPIYPPAKAVLQARGIPCEAHHAVQLQRTDAEQYDLFLGMDQMNLRNMKRILGDGAAKKCRGLAEYFGGTEIRDPWYTGKFDAVFDEITAGCEGLLEALARTGLRNEK